MLIQIHLLVNDLHYLHSHQSIQWPYAPFGWGPAILEETTPIRIEMLHQSIKLIAKNNFVLICNDPSLKQGQVDPNHASKTLPNRHHHCRGQTFRPVLFFLLPDRDTHPLVESIRPITFPHISAALTWWFLHHWTLRWAFIYLFRELYESFTHCNSTIMSVLIQPRSDCSCWHRLVTRCTDILSHLQEQLLCFALHIKRTQEHRSHQLLPIYWHLPHRFNSKCCFSQSSHESVWYGRHCLTEKIWTTIATYGRLTDAKARCVKTVSRENSGWTQPHVWASDMRSQQTIS